MSPTQIFHKFAELPTELRLMIYDFTRYHQQPRVLEIKCLPQPYTAYNGRNNARMFTRSPYSRRLPPCSQVCHEAREESHKSFTWLDIGCFVDYNRDYLYIGGSRIMSPSDTLIGSMYEGGGIDARKLRYLAVNQGSRYLSNLDAEVLELLARNLVELTTVLCEAQTGNRSWSFYELPHSLPHLITIRNLLRDATTSHDPDHDVDHLTKDYLGHKAEDTTCGRGADNANDSRNQATGKESHLPLVRAALLYEAHGSADDPAPQDNPMRSYFTTLEYNGTI